MGIYLNGGRKEEGLLLNFWKEHVSETYKALEEEKKHKLSSIMLLRNSKSCVNSREMIPLRIVSKWLRKLRKKRRERRNSLESRELL